MPLTDQLQHIVESIRLFLPETFLGVVFMLLLLAEMFLKYSRWATHTSQILRLSTIFFLLLSIDLVLDQKDLNPQYFFNKLLYINQQANYFKILLAVASICVLVHIQLTKTKLPTEFYAILIAVQVGLNLMTMANNGLSMYLALEMVSVGGYMMVAFGNDKQAGEGGIKYLLYGVVTSAIMLYGFSLLYGLGGSFDFLSTTFVQNLHNQPNWVVSVAILLSLSGLFFKLSLVPFQVYAPDVYEAAPTPVVAFLSVAPKAAALLLLVRFSTAFLSNFQPIIAAIALASILIGNLSALWQSSFKRLLAYSGMAQAGFLLVGIVANNSLGTQAVIFYITVYVFMNLATFFLLDILGDGKSKLEDFAGLGSRYPLLAILLTFNLVALVGLPPTAGFTAKLLVFSALWQHYQTSPQPLMFWLFVIGLLNAAVSLFYYLKLPYFMFFKQNKTQPASKMSFSVVIWAILLTLPLLWFFFKPTV